MAIVERSVQRIGKSLLISLPKTWADSLHVKKAAKLKMQVGEDGTLLIRPEFVQQKMEPATIPFDQHVERRFIREYFGGRDTIHISLTPTATPERRQRFHKYLQRFMNVQVVEESEKRFTIKCFRINELSVRECLQRMYYLVLTMFDDRVNGKAISQETRDNVTRFYYMLVMQVRVFLSGGRFVEDKTLTLLRAMDYRMVAEKIQRIAGVLAQTSKASKQARDYYAHAVSAFINEDFEKALPLYNDGRRLIEQQKNENKLLVQYSREISTLVR